MPDIRDVEIIAPNFKRRLSGVTSTIVQLIPCQIRLGIRIATLGPGLPEGLAKLKWPQLLGLWRPPARRRHRIWHARRNNEMAVGILLRHVLRMPLKLLFTSAAQRHHTAYTKWLIRRMDAVIATSDRSGSFLEVPHTVIQHGVDLSLFHPPETAEDAIAATGLPGRYLVGCFGRVRHQKGTDLFVQAMIELLPQRPEWTAVVSGRVTAEHAAFGEKLKADVAAAGLSDRILFLGEVPDIKIWYRRLTLYVAPSRNEGFGLTPLEAMASRTAVVASDAGAYAEQIVGGETGAVVAAGDGEALTRVIARYLADPALAIAHGDNGLRHVRENFALEKEASAIGAVYDRLLGDNRG
ncbi:glycosyltransferase family 4 protein [Rhizobium bangladeshense]|uniref:Glycosyltransferase family 4 protein n=1 Tax=Rhizobium bangladeshense TaxID=1138189 RepID=A0ABS7LB64_9HYPH|nr:glycosyltransferase family 4 protein [Rhizobium bangladeshense]MBX4873326.1 glycosyltransferase family 4 protein [Rhizobium bangladeshense]MBX4883427.1 glycosyltransferase family 4 protein [Rhizobium bangladeshense]MBX4894361.1 glycosyltransferase family 4 protein [Rhizobium bangladeshense]MBY3588707.1 glycosyltransferase family 4 protein [Rhizobium bangladeshense]MBY3611939.1 glycosyltransferase family 4 protein [Rhizobium bangladeshense]